MDDIQGDYVSSLYFPKPEGTGDSYKVRGLMDPYPNAVDTELERMRLDGVEGFIRVIQVAASEWSLAMGRSADLGFAKEDWRKGFKQLWLHPSQRRLYGIHLKHWASNKVMVLFPNVIVFGPRKGPAQFSRAPLLICHILRKVFHIPAHPHIDDIAILEECGPIGDQAHRIVVGLHELCGWKLNQAKRFPVGLPTLAQAGVVLGLRIALVHPSHESAKTIVATAELDDIKASKYIALLDDCLARSELTASDADKVAGQGSYTQTHCWKRSSRVLLWPLYERSRRPGLRHMTPHLAWCCQGLRCLYQQRTPRYIPHLGASGPRAEVYTDARGTVAGEWGSEYLGGLLHFEGIFEYYMSPVDLVGAEHLDPHGFHRINQCEGLAALVALSTWAQRLRGSWVTLYIDNQAAEVTLAKGYSRSLLMAKMSASFWRLAERNHIGVFIQRVPSSLNPSDALSRGDDSEALSLGATRVRARCEPSSRFGWSPCNDVMPYR